MDDALNIAFQNNPFGVLAGIALVILCFYIGLSLLFNGWPRLRK